MSDSASQHFRPTYDGQEAWLRYAGLARIVVLSFVIVGAAIIRGRLGIFGLLPLYLFWLATSIWYLRALGRQKTLAPRQTWTQLLVDFSMVAVTVALTQGPTSYFTVVFVIVVLEAGVLLAMRQAFIVATLATVFMGAVFFFYVLTDSPNLEITQFGNTVRPASTFELLYNFLVQALAFFLTAFLSGHWNQRITRMVRFQREILDNMNSGFLITDARGTVVVQNRAASHILGLGDAETVGRPIDQILRVASGAECPAVTALRLNRDYTSYEFRAATPGGQSRLLGLTTNRIKDPNGAATGLIISFSDLTAMDELRQEMRRQDRMAVVGELAAGLAHEIRNPVAVIRGAVDEMGDHVQEYPMAARLFAIALRESDHLNDIVTGFLDFAREPEMNRQTFDVREVVHEVAALLQLENYENPRLDVIAACPSEPCFINGDPSQIKQIFVNLGKNAVEAMEAVGALTIVVAKSGGPVEIRFEDDGPGIAPDKIARIFEPFYTTKRTGVGMGLAVCMRIVTAHDGTLRASSREGGGCSMVVSLPAAKIKEALLAQ